MAGNGILEVTDANFDQDVLKSDQPVLVDFWAAWCGPCRALAPIVDELAKDYTGKIKVGKMDVDSNSATPMRYGVRGIPTLLVFKGGQVKEQIVGYVPKETIQKAIEPQGVGVVIEARHLCMMMRGVEKQHSAAVTSSMLGCFRNEQETRTEFLSLIRNRTNGV